MGWSCSKAAGDVISEMWRLCREQTGSSNTYRVGDSEYIAEESRKEHDDGAITGTIMRFTLKRPDGSGQAVRAGSFRIDGDGTVKRGPAILKQAARNVAARASDNIPFLQIVTAKGSV